MLVPYDPTWPDEYAVAAASIRACGNEAWLVEHIGSTAIPGMVSKPIIDLAVRVDHRMDFETHRPGLEAGGWRIGSSVRNHQVMLKQRDGARTHIAHFFERAAWATVNQRIFRDWLVSHPEDASRYETAKRQALHDAKAGRASYNDGKTRIIQEIMGRARAGLCLPPVAVHDK